MNIGGLAPHILSIDDYFTQIQGREESKDPLTKQVINKPVSFYCFQKQNQNIDILD